jgi:hypothetical protein
MHDFDGIGDMQINFDKIIEDRKMLSVTRLLAAQMKNNPYLTVGDFVKSLSDMDLDLLIDVAEEVDSEHYQQAPHLDEIILITEMLVRAEGLVSPDSAVLVGRVNSFCVFLACEGLFRKGLIKLHHNNMSFGEDMGRNILVEKIDGINYDDFI